MVTKCPKCHSENPDTLKFCGECGTQLSSAKEIPAVPTETFQTPVRELTTGSTFAGRYQIIEELGKGGMGRVYKVFDTEIHEKIALKLLKPEVAEDQETINRFRNELKTARRIGHRNVCRMFDLNRAEGTYYITMEYVAGEDLKKLIRKIGQMPVGKAVSIAKQVCDGLAEAHALGIVHRDLKPQNVMVDEGGSAHIMDFGIARTMKGAGMTGAGVIIGTPEYMSPEQVEAKEVDQRSDVYSLGVILYEMVAGRVPFEADTPFAIGVKHKSEIPRNPREFNAHIPEDLSRLILKCLEKDKAMRYQSADALRADLERIEEGLPTTEKIIPKRKGLTTRDITVTFNARKLVVPALAILALVAAGILLWKFFGKAKPAPVATFGKPSIAVMYFENQTEKQGLDKMLVTLLTTNLSRYKNIEVTSTQRLFDILKLLGKQDAQAIDRSLATDVATRAGVKTMLLGSIIQIGDRIRLTSELVDVKTGSIIGTQAEDGAKYDDIFGMVDRITEQVGQQIGGSKGEGSLKVAEVTTSSLEALDYYQKGYDQMLRWSYPKATEYFRKAVETDPAFAVAYAYLAMTKLGSPASLFDLYTDVTEAQKILESAKKYSDRATDSERLMIRMVESMLNRDHQAAAGLGREIIARNVPEKWAYYSFMWEQLDRHDFRAAIRTMEMALENDPTDGNSYNMIGYCNGWLKDYPAAISAMKKYIAVNPDISNSYDGAWEISMWAGQFDEAIRYADEAMKANPAWTWFDRLAGWAYIHKAQGEEARERFRRLAQKSPGRGIGLAMNTALSYLREGRHKEAEAEYLKALELSQKSDDIGTEINCRANLGEIMLIQNKFAVTVAQFREAERVSGKFYKHDFNPIPLDVRLYVGRAFVKQRQYDKAESAAREIRLIVQDRRMNPSYLDFSYLLEAEIAMAQNRPEEALASLDRTSFHAYWSSPFYWRTRASAEEALGRFEAAAESYQKFLGHVILARQDLYDPVRYFYEQSMLDYNLGRISEKMKNPSAAKEHYQRFLDGMKSADPDIAEVTDARKRLAELKAN
jgi:serine/threonine protein kinase/tetratricopeptide (TPR) repeat protein